ncbi:hypothetical protein SAMN05421780_101533 [Flexibacter flexilis DSM 6793]|uniref:Uncharacterized protein n=1 Tax=Flexibacter flexilis DSM 6793 TaxID=927664 RepID=A0A1I1DYM2_9BACT|nr:hypothetical protein [Flexibacter flexilis]SFB79924.1 hypothetical protein SAMN05421780_101533 [Flexibacter flexilis DSM 6793]
MQQRQYPDLKLYVFDSANYPSEAAAYTAACAKELIFANRVGCPYQFGYSPVWEKYKVSPKVYYFNVADLLNEEPALFEPADIAELTTVTYADFQAWLDNESGLPQAAANPAGESQSM